MGAGVLSSCPMESIVYEDYLSFDGAPREKFKRLSRIQKWERMVD
jgi:hypothetical protein